MTVDLRIRILLTDRVTLKALMLILMSFVSASLFADNVEIDGIYYNLIDKGSIAEVTSNPDKYTGEVVIPSYVVYDGYRYDVTSIDAGAFSGCGGLTSISIPNSVTSIGNYAGSIGFSVS